MGSSRVRSVGLGFALVSVLTFGGSGALAKVLIGAGFSPQQAAWLRIIGAAVILVPIALWLRGASGIEAARRNWRPLVLYGATGIAACQTLYILSASRLPVGVAVLLEFTGPLLVVGWIRFVRRGHVPPAAVAGVGIAMVGLACVVEVWSGLRLDLVGLLAGLGAAAGNAAYFLLVDRMTGAADPLVMTSTGMVAAGIVLTAVAAPWSAPWHVLDDTVEAGPVWIFAVSIVLISTVVAYLAGAAAVQRLSAPIGGAVAYLEVVAASVYAWLLLNEALTPAQIIGGSIVVVGAFVAQRSSSSLKTAPALSQVHSSATHALPLDPIDLAPTGSDSSSTSRTATATELYGSTR
jgi:drug/metabolite transporter (DMT)-like permease